MNPIKKYISIENTGWEERFDKAFGVGLITHFNSQRALQEIKSFISVEIQKAVAEYKKGLKEKIEKIETLYPGGVFPEIDPAGRGIIAKVIKEEPKFPMRVYFFLI